MNLLMALTTRPLLSLAFGAVSLLTLSQQQAAQAGPATVSGQINCDTEGMGFAIAINGEIDAATTTSVREQLNQFHEQEARFRSGGKKCIGDMYVQKVGFGANDSSFQINSGGGDVAAAMAIGRMIRKEGTQLGNSR